MDSENDFIQPTKAFIDSSIASITMHKLYNDWEYVTNVCSQIIDAAMKVLDIDDLSSDTKYDVLRGLYFALHNMALSSYLDDDCTTAIKYLDAIDLNVFPMSAPLMGRCKQVYISSTTNDPKLAWSTMLEYYRIFIQHEDEVFAENPAGIDQVLIGRAYFNLSLTYKDGIGVPRSLETAQRYLLQGISRLDQDDALKPLREELSHYQTGFFGGLKYV